MKIEMFPLGPLMTNAYLVYDPAQEAGILFDPGMNPAPLIKRIKEIKVQIEAILLTHAHFDHIGGLEEVRELTQAPVYIHEQESDWLTNPQLNSSGLWMQEIVCQPAESILYGGEEIHLLNKKFQVLHTPGHSPGSVSYLCGSYLFSGDVLFKNSVGRTDLPGGNWDVLMKSIQQQLLTLPDETQVLCGHGPITSIGVERKYNPFLQG